MIISRTPLRVSFIGGGTDLSAFYTRETGEVISTAIDKYMYVTVNKRFDDTIRLSYTRTEIVDRIDQLRHELVRQAMKLTGVTKGIEITTIADIPAKGTGLGSSSSLTVGLLNALYAYKGKRVPTRRLAEEACRIEIDILKEPIGKQDQYIAAYGGMKHFYFKQNGEVVVEPLLVERKTLAYLQDTLLMFYTKVTRSAHSILREQKKNTGDHFEELRSLKQLVVPLRRSLEAGAVGQKEFGLVLHKGWEIKKRLARTISNTTIDRYYRKALDAGATGGKILGAGGGGFLLLYCRKEYQQKVRKALAPLACMPFAFEPEGSRIIYADY
ncbi:MAG: GHMP kinase [Candidatus Omnitrophica bacterium]|nr:GHMP kinase [Candidatus Omnitrophota bacterium]